MGSEMCIRDRHCPAGVCGGDTAGGGAADGRTGAAPKASAALRGSRCAAAHRLARPAAFQLFYLPAKRMLLPVSSGDSDLSLISTCCRISAAFFTRILYLLYTLPAPKQALTQNLGQAFTYFSRNSQIQRKNCAISAGSGLSTVTVRRVVSSTGASMQMPSSSVSQRGTRNVWRAQWRACRPMRALLPP